MLLPVIPSGVGESLAVACDLVSVRNPKPPVPLFECVRAIYFSNLLKNKRSLLGMYVATYIHKRSQNKEGSNEFDFRDWENSRQLGDC